MTQRNATQSKAIETKQLSFFISVSISIRYLLLPRIVRRLQAVISAQSARSLTDKTGRAVGRFCQLARSEYSFWGRAACAATLLHDYILSRATLLLAPSDSPVSLPYCRFLPSFPNLPTILDGTVPHGASQCLLGASLVLLGIEY